MDKPLKYHAKKQDTKGKMLYNSTLIKCFGQASSQRQKVEQRLPEARESREWGVGIVTIQ